MCLDILLIALLSTSIIVIAVYEANRGKHAKK